MVRQLSRFLKSQSSRCLVMLGLTETTAPCHAQNVEDGERHFGSCGKLLPNLQVRLVDIDLKDVKKGAPGEICVRGPTVMKYVHG